MLLRVAGRCVDGTDVEAALLTLTDSAEFEWRWPETGWVRAYWLSTTSGLVLDRGGLEVAFYRRGKNVVTDDFLQRQFAPSCLTCGADPVSPDFAPLFAEVTSREPWIIQLRNRGPNTVTPRLIFDFLGLGEIDRLRDFS